jgi:single-strand DNA-binding protein
MFETNIVVVGNVLTAPEWRRTSNNHMVASFRVASTARRLDRDTGRWIDGNHLRVRVSCWRRLAEGVGASIMVGDPIIVVGRLHTRDWTDGDGNPRTSFELDAVAVGHDLARGKGRFYRNRPPGATSEADGPELAGYVGGEAAELVPDEEAPATYGAGMPDEEEPGFDAPPSRLDPVSTLIGLTAPEDGRPVEDELAPVGEEPAEPDPGEPAAEAAEGSGRRRPRRAARREPVPA